MAYKIEPIPLTNFIEEKKIKLPRFQRKATWKDKQNFELAISIFQGYPVGVVIINKEKKASWLLDGRQRRNALKTMRENPVELYIWASRYLKFKQNADEYEIRRIFQSKVDAYLQTEDKEDDDYIEEINKEIDDIEENSFNLDEQTKGLETLLDIILMVHKKPKNSLSTWEKLFDFREHFDILRYAKNINGEKVIDPVLLRKFLLDLISEYLGEYDGDITKEFFIDYYYESFGISETEKKKFEKNVDRNWKNISNSLNIISATENVFREARIGVIELINASPLDAQNIFSRINSGGTQLKSEELLSAKPFWNEPYPSTDKDLLEKISQLYMKLGVNWDGNVVKWDAIAVLISMIDKDNLIFDTKSEGEKVDIELVTLGFKLISANFVKGITANHVNQLEFAKNINWNYDIKNFENEMHIIIKLLLTDQYFKIFKEWRISLSKLIGKAPALEFINIVYLNWLDKNKPTANSGEGKAVIRDARILLDRLIYEYSIRRWTGSSDSKVALDLTNWKNRLVSIEKDDWKKLINELSKGSINGNQVKQTVLTPLLYYIEMLKENLPDNENYEIDHIYPQEKFNNNSVVNPNYKDSLTNLILLQKSHNNAKKSKPLNEVNDVVLKKAISKASGIIEDDFNKYSDISKFDDLIKQRTEYLIDIITESRDKFISN